MKKKLSFFVFILLFSILSSSLSFSQCMNIESILVDACEGTTNAEGQNEMVRFKIGNAPLNTNQMNVNWPSNQWLGLIQNTATEQKVNLINQEILAAGGCGQVLEPVGGVLPANAKVIIVTSHLFELSLNPFGAVNETIYMLFQNSTVTGGHFANYGTGNRSLTISFGSCRSTVTYDRSQLIDQNGNHVAGDGATVNFSPTGLATYVNDGCRAPVATLVFDITQFPTTSCANTTFSLVGEATGAQSVSWSSNDGVFSAPTSLATNFTVNDTNRNSVSITFKMINMCGVEVSKTIQVQLQNQEEPIFTNLPNQICTDNDRPILPTTSSNGITGTWSPATVSDNYQGDYVFTPTAGQCAKVISRKIQISKLVLNLIGECDGSSYMLKASSTGGNDVQYVWKDQFGRIVGTNSSIFNVTEYVKDMNLFSFPMTFSLTATLGTCTLTESIIVTSLNCSIQKGVSPNGDSKNDFFDLRTLAVLKLSIYNRYGTEVYQKGVYQDEWYGQNKKGDLLPVGTYFYSILTLDNKTITGWIQLMY